MRKKNNSCKKKELITPTAFIQNLYWSTHSDINMENTTALIKSLWRIIDSGNLSIFCRPLSVSPGINNLYANVIFQCDVYRSCRLSRKQSNLYTCCRHSMVPLPRSCHSLLFSPSLFWRGQSINAGVPPV